MPQPERKRRRPAVSCIPCRRRKIKCDRETPCSNCVRFKHETCVYENRPPPSQRSAAQGQRAIPVPVVMELKDGPLPVWDASSVARTPDSGGGGGGGGLMPRPPTSGRSVASTSIGSSTLASNTSVSDVVYMRNRIRQLEDELSKGQRPLPPPSPIPTVNSNIETTTSQIAGTYHLAQEPTGVGQAYPITRSVMHKSRLFGQSHWAHAAALFKDVFEMIEPHVRAETSKASVGLKRCKELARVIKARRAPKWPSPPTADLPPKALADELVDAYLRTIESVYRILHVPSFRSEYEKLWASDGVPETSFLVQLKLVLAIGASFYDEDFSMRSSAVTWAYEAQAYLAEPEFKSRLNIQGLQISLLLIISRETAAVGSDMVWTSVGELFRTAIFMGLHRDPSRLPNRTVFAAEMRRRLWNTILEMVLQSSLTSGAPPQISMEDFDTEPPGNFDDDQLLADDPVPRPEAAYTRVSTSILLRRTFPQRLAIVKFMNDLSSHGTYEETIRLDTALRESYRAVCRSLREYKQESISMPTSFETSLVDLLNHRYLSALHIPFFGASLHEARYAFSRKVVIESSLKIWCTVYPSSSIMAAHPGGETVPNSTSNDLDRLTTCASGFFRTAIMQSTLFIAVELRTQIQEEESLGASPYRVDLLSVLGEAEKWSWKCIRAGETNIKGYLFACLITAQIGGLMRGLRSEDMPELLVRAAEGAEERCLELFEQWVAKGREGDALTSPSNPSLNMPPILMDDWGFIMSDSFFDFGNAEPMNWAFNE